MSDQFPRAIYKSSTGGSAEPVWGLGTFDVKAVDAQDALDAALADGWTLRPDDEPASADLTAPDPPKKSRPAPAEKPAPAEQAD